MDETLDPPKIVTGLLLIDSLLEGNFKVFSDAFSHLILPGVGSFKNAMDNLSSKGLDTIIKKVVKEDKKPIIGICLGMQLLCTSSMEEGFNKGLDLIDAVVEKIDEKDLKVPHVGFNQVKPHINSQLFKDMGKSVDFYFTHSFKVNSCVDINQSMCLYGNKFISSFEKDNIYAVQFHPELSQVNGLKLLENFIKIKNA